MSKVQKLIAAALFLLVLIGASTFFYKPNSPNDNKTGAVVSASPDKSPVAAGEQLYDKAELKSLKSLTTAAQVSATESPGRQLAKLYETSNNKRQFFDEARLRPQDGGAYLADLAASECMLFARKGTIKTIEMKNSLVPIDAPNKAERLNAIKKLHEPCIGFDAAPISSATLKQLRIDGENAGDPVLKAQRDMRSVFTAGGDVALVPSILKSAADAKTPDAINAALVNLSVGLAVDDIVLNGHKIEPSDSSAFVIAASLVSCQFGRDCGPTSQGSLQFCTSGNCGLDAYELMRSGGLPPLNSLR